MQCRVFVRGTARLVPFQGAGVMHLTGRTVENLELLANETDGSVHGSLLWIVDRTRTHFGRRMLRRWIASPLTVRSYVACRAPRAICGGGSDVCLAWRLFADALKSG
jgi:DNA mismatch repair protein MSH3